MIPEAYREMRAVARTATADRVEVEELYRRLGKAPSETVYKIGGVVRAIVGAFSIAGTGFIRVWRVALVDIGPSLFDGNVDGAGLVIFAIIALAPLIVVCGLLYGLDCVVWSVSPGADVWGANISVGAALYVMIVVAGLRQFWQERIALRRRLQAELVAQPPSHADGPALCRECGAALTVPATAFGVRCDYCGADNLVALPSWLVSQSKQVAGEHHKQIQESIGEVAGERVMSARRAVNSVLLGLLIFPVVFFCAEIVLALVKRHP